MTLTERSICNRGIRTLLIAPIILLSTRARSHLAKTQQRDVFHFCRILSNAKEMSLIRVLRLVSCGIDSYCRVSTERSSCGIRSWKLGYREQLLFNSCFPLTAGWLIFIKGCLDRRLGEMQAGVQRNSRQVGNGAPFTFSGCVRDTTASPTSTMTPISRSSLHLLQNF